MMRDPGYYDVKVAGWWVWGQRMWIGSGWCVRRTGADDLGDAGTGVHRKRPHLSNAGKGVHRKRPMLGGHGGGSGVHRQSQELFSYMENLSDRLRFVRVCCGDWSRVCGPSPTFKHGMTAVFLDPPYSAEAGRTDEIYSAEDLSVSHDVARWAMENGPNPDLRIALCGYEGEHQMPPDWECLPWKASGGFGSQGNNVGRENAARERIWFSPHCLKQRGLF